MRSIDLLGGVFLADTALSWCILDRPCLFHTCSPSFSFSLYWQKVKSPCPKSPADVSSLSLSFILSLSHTHTFTNRWTLIKVKNVISLLLSIAFIYFNLVFLPVHHELNTYLTERLWCMRRLTAVCLLVGQQNKTLPVSILPSHLLPPTPHGQFSTEQSSVLPSCGFL